MLNGLLDAIQLGESRALVVRGEPGVGKTALLEYLVGRVAGARVARAAGVQSEMELPFAALHQLCAPMLDRLERLPGPQHDALATAFGLSAGNPPDRFLIGLAVLGLFAEVAQEQPLVCVVDDAQWLDHASAQALTFVARRLGAESVASVFAVRGHDEINALAGLTELKVGGLPDADARALLGSALRGPVDEQVLDRIVAETRGNPLALLELPRGLTPAELAGGFGLPNAPALPTRIEDSFQRQLQPLPAETRRLLLIAAADPLGEPTLVWRATELLGIGSDAAAPALDAGLVEIGARVRFRHPLLRSAIYRAASTQDRQEAHRVLTEVTDPEVDPDRRAWHAAQAASGPDEGVAADLEHSAGRAQARGGLAAAAAFLERATELTLAAALRGNRALAAAQARYQAGAPDAALRLLSIAEAGPPDLLRRARVDLLRAQIAFAVNRGRDAAPMLLKAARQFERLDARLARDTYLDALFAAWIAGPLASGGGIREVAEAVHAAPSAQPPRAADLLLDGLATRITEGYAAAMPMLKRALRAFCSPDLPTQEGLRWLWFACTPALDLWDHDSWEVQATRHVGLAREAGALAVLPLALTSRCAMLIFAGDLAAAESLSEEVEAVNEATESHLVSYGAVMLAAWRGREAETRKLVESATEEALRRGEGIALSVTAWATALLDNSLGRYGDALSAARPAADMRPEARSAPLWVLVELIEAAVRSGMPEQAADALQRLSTTTRASGTDWGLGIEARSRALLSEGPDAETAYREAIDRLGRTRIRGELARAHLLHGEWLRCEGRRSDAREQLHVAHRMFSAMGMEAFAQRAERELLATGEHARRRTVETSTELTAQEAQIARLVREGLSNTEIGAQLFISPRTVEWHLHKIFNKLNINSRKQLHR